MKEAEKAYYTAEIAPVLPPRVLDFHTHIWSSRTWRDRPWESGTKGGKYMVTIEDYGAGDLLADGKACFPDRTYEAVCFGKPCPGIDWEGDTAFVADEARQHEALWPLVLAGPDLGVSRDRYEAVIGQGGFHGFKVFLNWHGNDYGDKRVEEMVGPVERELANAHRLIVLLHVPRRGRLADPEIQAGVRWLAAACPDARIVLAHCGRCYLPGEMKAAIGCLEGLENVWLDTSMVMDPVVIQIALNAIGPSRLVFGTDFPIAAMRGRRVRVMDHWVDVVAPGQPESAFRVVGTDIHAASMAWEIVLAIRWAAELTGIRTAERDAIFYDNGRALLGTC